MSSNIDEKIVLGLDIPKSKAAITKDLKKVMKDIPTQKIKLNTDTSELTKSVQKAMKNLQIDGTASVEFQEVQSNLKEINTEMQETEKLGSSFGNTLAAAGQKLKGWGVFAGIIDEVVQSLKNSISEIKDIDTTITEISKVSNLSTKKLKELGDNSFETASKYGVKASSYMNGVLKMSHSGYNGRKAAAMAEESMLAQAAGNLPEDVANQYLLAIDAAYQYNGEIKKLNAVLDGQNNITNKNQLAMIDMATAMNEAGSVASGYRVSIEDLSAMIGTIEAITKLSGNEAGNSITSILDNLQNDSSSKITDTLDKANVSMTELVNGTEQLRNPISILRDLSQTFSKLGDADPLKSEILTNIGGEEQASQLAALLGNMNLFDKMLVDYSEGSGSAMTDAMDSANNLEGSLAKLSNTTTSIINNVADSSFMTGAVNGLNGILTIVNHLTETIGPLGTIGVGLGAFLGSQNIGRCA